VVSNDGSNEDADFPSKGILGRGWDEATLGFIAEKRRPVLLFVADRDPTISPFLRELLRAMPRNAKLRGLLHEHFPALLIEADAVPQDLAMLGAGSTYHVAVLSPYGLTPIVTIDPVHGNPNEVVDEIVHILERLVDVWA
jgi:hypothetical protein